VTISPQHSFYTNFFVIAFFIISILMTGCAGAALPVEHTIEVRDAQTGSTIGNAAVTGEVGLRYQVSATTGQDGTVTLAFDPEHLQLHQWVKLSVNAEGYPPLTTLANLEESSDPIVIELTTGQETSAPDAGEGPEAGETASVENSEPAAEAEPSEPMPTVDPADREFADIPAAERADYYTNRPEMAIDPGNNYQAIIATNKGDIVVSLDANAAPEHVNNFVFLSNSGFYDGLTFHRVEPDFVIQGGDPLGTGQGGPGYTIPGEFSLKHIEGALAMARLPDQINPNRESSGSQFYITLAPTPFLDDQYSVFGKVESGLDVVKSIEIGDVIEQVTVNVN
jgi:cyclophilin family peptidyl-prolyl cis-trans isomerase